MKESLRASTSLGVVSFRDPAAPLRGLVIGFLPRSSSCSLNASKSSYFQRTSPRTSQMPAAATFWWTPWIFTAFWITESPTLFLPRVTASSIMPSLYSRASDAPSSLYSSSNFLTPYFLYVSATHAQASSMPFALVMDTIGTTWVTFLKPSDKSSDACCVGDSGRITSGLFSSYSLS